MKNFIYYSLFTAFIILSFLSCQKESINIEDPIVSTPNNDITSSIENNTSEAESSPEEFVDYTINGHSFYFSDLDAAQSEYNSDLIIIKDLSDHPINQFRLTLQFNASGEPFLRSLLMGVEVEGEENVDNSVHHTFCEPIVYFHCGNVDLTLETFDNPGGYIIGSFEGEIHNEHLCVPRHVVEGTFKVIRN